MKHQKLAEKIKAELIELKEISPENIVFDSTDCWRCKDRGFERNEEKFKELEEIWENEDFPKNLLDRGFTNYVGCDTTGSGDLPLTIYVGKIKDRTYPRTNGILIRSLSSEIPTLYLITNHNPAMVGSYREEQLVFGLKYDVVGPLIEYVDKNVEWEYNPESMVYCDGSVFNEKNLEIAKNTLEYILVCLNISKPQN